MGNIMRAIAGLDSLRVVPSEGNRDFYRLYREGERFALASGPMSYLINHFDQVVKRSGGC